MFPQFSLTSSLWRTVCAFLLAINLYAQAPMAAPTEGSKAAQEGVTKFQEHELTRHDDWWHIRIKYPSLEAADEFNKIVRRDVDSMADSFGTSLPENAPTGYPNYGAYLEGAYEANVVKNGIISVLFDYTEYWPTAVHPWGILACINYDPRTRRRLELSDLFRPGSHYLTELSRISVRDLEQRENAEEEMIRQGAAPLKKNFAVFTVTDTDLILHFQQYQVAPGVVPADEVVIPLTNLASILRKEYLPAR